MATTLTKKSEADLRKMLKDKRSELQRFRFGMSGSKTRNVKRGRDVKKEIARILTELTRRRREESSQ